MRSPVQVYKLVAGGKPFREVCKRERGRDGPAWRFLLSDPTRPQGRRSLMLWGYRLRELIFKEVAASSYIGGLDLLDAAKANLVLLH